MAVRLVVIPLIDASNVEVFFSLPSGIVPVAGRTQQWVNLRRGDPRVFDLEMLLLDPGDQSVVGGAMAPHMSGAEALQAGALTRLLLQVGPDATTVQEIPTPSSGMDASSASLLVEVDAGAPPRLPRPAAVPASSALRCTGGSLSGNSGMAVRCSVADAPADQGMIRLSAWLLGPRGVIAKIDPLCTAMLQEGAAVCARDVNMPPQSWSGSAVVAGMLLPSGERFGPAVVLPEIEP
jgi:hypothetical protein